MPLNLGECRPKWNRITVSDGPQEPPRRTGERYFYQAPRDRASGTNRTTDVLAEGQRGETQGPSPGSVTAEGGVWMQSITLTWYLLVREEHRNPAWGLWQPGLWRLEAGTRVLQPLPGSTNGQEECSWATHCCLLAREEEGSDPVMHGSPLSFSWDPETEKSLLYWCFGYGTILTTHNNKILHLALHRGTERWLTISDEQSPRSLGCLSQGLSHHSPGPLEWTSHSFSRTLFCRKETSNFNHYRSAPKRKDELMRWTCCLLYSHCDQRQLDAMFACQCPLACLVTLEVDWSLARSQFRRSSDVTRSDRLIGNWC